MFYEDIRNLYSLPGIWHQHYQGLARFGAPYDIYLMQDLVDGKLLPYKLYVFLNAFHLNTARRAVLSRQLKRDGRTALWIYAPGYVAETLSMKRMDIARALAAKPEVLLLDEPFAHIDFETRAKVMSAISDYMAEAATILIVVTHEDFDLRYFLERSHDFPELVGAGKGR